MAIEHVHAISMTDALIGARPYVDHSARNGQGL